MQTLIIVAFVACLVTSVIFQGFGLRKQKLGVEAWQRVDGDKEYAFILLLKAFGHSSVGNVLLGVSGVLFLLYTMLFGFKPVG